MGLRTDVSNKDYHTSPELSRSTAFALNKTSPAHVKYSMDHPSPSTTPLVMGGCFHSAVLEPMKLEYEYGAKPAKIDGKSPLTNHYKAEFEHIANQNPGKRWLSQNDYNTCMEMAGAALDNPVLKDYMSDVDCITEGTGFFMEEGAECKVRLDLFCPSAEVIIDLKSTMDASERGFAKSVRQYGYDFQACWYLESLRKLGYSPKQFIFVCVEKTPPYVTACYTLEAYDIARHREPMRRACKLWASCVSSDIWPGYSDGVKTLELTRNYNRLSMQDIARKFNVGRHFVYKIVEQYGLETKYIANKRTLDINDFAQALQWDAEGKDAA